MAKEKNNEQVLPQRYMDAKTDISFKKLFGEQSSSDITISFLNAVLEKKGDEQITEVTIIEPANRLEGGNKKSSVVDVRCQDANGNRYIVEMQLVDEKNFRERSQYYVATGIAQQLEVGWDYEKIMPVVFVGVVNFDLDPDDHFLCHHAIMNTKTHQRILNHMEFHFVELKKFQKGLEELVTDVDKWVYLIKGASKCREVPESLKPNPAMAHAFGKLERGLWTENEIWAYMQYQEVMNREELLHRVWLREGMEKGALEAKFAIAQQMLAKGIDVAVVAEVTGLGVDEIKKLK